jgi:nitroreductase
VVVVAAKLPAHEDAARANGHAPPEVLKTLVPVIERTYEGKPQFQRDEAIRSASLAAMTLMLAAEAEGLATCPMIGFSPAKVAAIVDLDDRHVPVMLLCLGRRGRGQPFPTSRFPLAETVKLESLRGQGLQG